VQQQIDELLAKAREKHRSAQVSIDDVGADERIAGTARNRRQGFEIAGIGQLVDDENGVAAVADRMADYCRADKAGTTRHQDLHPPTSLVGSDSPLVVSTSSRRLRSRITCCDLPGFDQRFGSDACFWISANCWRSLPASKILPEIVDLRLEGGVLLFEFVQHPYFS